MSERSGDASQMPRVGRQKAARFLSDGSSVRGAAGGGLNFLCGVGKVVRRRSDDGVESGQSRAAHRRRAMRLVERRVVEECHSGRGEDEVCG